MILIKTSASLLAVLIAVAPATAEDVAPDDPASLPLDEPAAGGQSVPHWLLCARRCKNNCRGKPNAKRCAMNFISSKCKPFSRRVGDVVLTKCLAAVDCEKNGMKVCENNLQCLLKEQCCLEGGCNAEKFRCVNHWCAAKGSPSFTLTWSGNDELELHVTTPDGFELYDEDGARFDPDSGGRFQQRDVPDTNTTWQETVYFPLDGSATEGIYEFFVRSLHIDADPANPDPAMPYTVTIYEGEDLMPTESGEVESEADSDVYEYEYMA